MLLQIFVLIIFAFILKFHCYKDMRYQNEINSLKTIIAYFTHGDSISFVAFSFRKVFLGALKYEINYCKYLKFGIYLPLII